jgi:hypothetical protein
VFFPAPPPPGGAHYGVLYTSKQAEVNFDRPAGLLAADGGNGAGGRAALRLIPLTPQNRGLAADLARMGRAAWALPGHPGWQVLPEGTVRGRIE